MIPPKNRIDNWQETLDEKAEEILSIANRNHVSAILQGGDFTDKPKIQDEYHTKIIKRWSTANIYDIVKKLATNEISQEKVLEELKKGKPIISIAGNHDQFGSSMQGFGKTTLAFLEQIGLVNLVTKKKPIILTDDSGFTVAITGSNYSLNMDKDEKRKAYTVDKKLGDFHIHIVHGMLTNQNFGNLFAHTRIEEIKDTKADLTIAGHDHIGFDPVEIDGKYFVNPGSITRLSNDDKEMNRQPKVMVIEVTKEKGIQLKMKPLKCAKPASEVLSTENKEIKKEMNNRIQKIKDSLDTVSVDTVKDIIDIVEEMPLSGNFTQDMKYELKDKIIEKMKKDNSKPLNDPTPYIFTKMELENFQCHKYSVLEFDKRLNVIVGESDKGKSSIIRAFEFVFGESDSAAKEYIRHGSNFASVRLYMDNGVIIERKVEKKSNGFNGYNIYSPVDQKWIKSNTKNTPEIQTLLGYSLMSVDEKTKLSVNFFNQDDSHFFISKNTTPSTRAKIIGTVYKTHYGDAVLRDLENEFKKSNTKLLAKREDVKRYRNEVECMVHVEPLGELVDKTRNLINKIEEKKMRLSLIKQKCDKVNILGSKIRKHTAYVEKTKKVLNKKSQIETITLLQKSLDTKNIMINKMIRDRETGVKLGRYIKAASPILSNKKNISNISERVRNNKTNITSLNNLVRMQKKGRALSLYCGRAKKMIDEKTLLLNTINSAQTLYEQQNKYSDLKVIQEKGIVLRDEVKELKPLYTKSKDLYYMIKELTEKNNNKKQLYVSLGEKMKEHNAVNKEYKALSSELNENKEEYKNFLKEIKVCPVCMHTFDERTIDNMIRKD